MVLAFGSDHAGFKLRKFLEQRAVEAGHTIQSFGALSQESFDYPVAADPVCEAVLKGEAEFGILICGSGVGISIRANRHPGIRCALCFTPELAAMAREHNHANVLALGERLLEPEMASQILSTFLTTEPDTAERHVRRVQQLDAGCS